MKLIFIGLAVWRLSNMLLFDGGPGRFFVFLREVFAGIEHDDEDYPAIIPETSMGKLFSCIKCMSVWIGVFFAILWMLYPNICFAIALPFSLSAVAIIVDTVGYNGYNNV